MLRIIPLKKRFVNRVCIFIQRFVNFMYIVYVISRTMLFIMTNIHIVMYRIDAYMQMDRGWMRIDLFRRQ